MGKKHSIQYAAGDSVEYLYEYRTGATWVPAIVEAVNKATVRITYTFHGREIMTSTNKSRLR